MEKLLERIRTCEVCTNFLPNKPRPILQVGAKSKIVIIGQAPGQKVQNSGIPWNDQSGKELRRWLNVSEEQFYNQDIFAFIPMGFCYPGSNAKGDLPPRPECAPLWHSELLKEIENIKIILLIGQYSQKYYLGNSFKSSITENVKNYSTFLPSYLPLIHPSPRNKIWQKKNPWFELEVVPFLQKLILESLLI